MKPGSHVVFAMLPHFGHYNGTFKLARDLLARGHAVTYVGIEESMRGHAEAAGFAYASTALVPERARASLPRATPAWLRSVVDQRRFVQALADGRSLSAFVEKLKPDVFLIDCNLTVLALSLQRFSFPTVMLNTQLPLDEDPGIPPLDTWALPGPGARSHWLAKAGWQRHYARRLVQDLSLSPLGLSEMQMLRPIARAANVDLRRLRSRRHVNRVLDLPEIVLNPQALDVPRPPTPGRYWSEAGVEAVGDAQLQEPVFAEFLADARPLVLVSLGTVGTEKKAFSRSMDAVVAAAERLPRFKFAIAGHPAAGDPGASKPENVYLFRYVPQQAMLSRAAVLVTHGGVNGLKEAIVAEVPIVVLARPGADWYGNAARIAYHRLGFRRKAADIEIDDLAQIIEAAHDDVDVRARLRMMRDRFLEAERETPAWRVLEDILDRPSPGL